jgi:ribosomal protein S27AE
MGTIDASELTQEILSLTVLYDNDYYRGRADERNDILQLIRKISIINSIENGEWINPHWRNSISCANCSICGFEAQHKEYLGVQKYYKLCPNCGAKMKGAF